MPLVQPTGAIRTLAAATYVDSIFSADSTRLYTVSGNMLSIFDTATGLRLSTITFGTTLGRLDLSPDGQYLAVVESSPSGGLGTVHRVALATGVVDTSVISGTTTFFDAVYRADGFLVLSQQVSAPLVMVRLGTGDRSSLQQVDAYAVLTASADATYIAAQGDSLTLRIDSFDLDTGTGYRILSRPDPYAGASFPSSGNRIGAVSPDGSMIVQASSGRVYSSNLNSYVTLPANPDIGGSAMTFSPDGTRLYTVSASSDRLAVVDTATWAVIATYDIGGNVIGPFELRISDDGDFLSILTADGIQLIDLDLAIPDNRPSAGNDDLAGNHNNDRIDGLAGADTIAGGAGNDLLASNGFGAFDASLDIYADHDSISGGDGSDRIYAGYGDDVDGGTDGFDGDSLYLSLLGSPVGLTVDFRLPSQTIGGGTITGIEAVRWVQGTNFDDVITDANNLTAFIGSSLYGMAGNDRLVAGRSTGLLDGGDGNDVLDGRGSIVLGTVRGGAGNDTIYADVASAATAYGDDGDDLIYSTYAAYGGRGNDIIILSASSSLFTVNAYGEDGDDVITASSGETFITGGAGADRITGGTGPDILGSASPVDSLARQSADDMGLERDVVAGGGGNDWISIGYGDSADGGTSTDTLRLSMGGLQQGIQFNTAIFVLDAPILLGGGTIQNFELFQYVRTTEFDDVITAVDYFGSLTINAGGGNDVITASVGSLAVMGGDGDDTLIVTGFSGGSGGPTVTFLGGGGNDTVDFRNALRSVDVTLRNEEGWSSYSTNVSMSDTENVLGSIYADILRGNDRNNVLDGRGSPDQLFGNGGNDIITGGGASDYDTLSGGTGFDTFRDTAVGLNSDTITDFSAEDRIIISDATLAGFTFSLSGSTLSFTGGSVTLTGGFAGTLVASAAVGGGVQLSVQALVTADVRNDFNGDGRSDILWRNSNGTLIDWLGNANGTFTRNHAVATYALDANFAVVGTGDFNGDGRDDLLLRNTNGTVTDWLGQANGGFVSNHAVSTYALGTNWTVAGTGDFNGDGRDDILWRNEVGAMSQWLGQTNGSFAYNAAAAYQLPTNWTAAATGDFNGDGRDDIMWRNEVGALSEWLGQTNGGYVYNANAAYQLGTNWTLAASADFNGDGRDDILWRNEVGAMSQWLANADGTFAYNANAAYQLPTNWALATVGDFNGDGRDDILWRNEVGAMAEWLGQTNGTFAYNPDAAYQLATTWQVQDPGI